MSLLPNERPVELPEGSQTPRILHHPEYTTTAGPEAVDFCKAVGLFLDPWQQLIFEHALGENPDGTWASFEIGAVVNRQNGKGEILMAREIVGLFLFGEKLIIHSAHEFKTALEAFKRIKGLIRNCPMLDSRVKEIRNSHGEECIELHTGERLQFMARSKSSGRGFTGDVIVLDEAQILTDDAVDAMLPTLSTKQGTGQVWYTGTAGTLASTHLGRVRERGIKGSDRSLTYLEWSVDPEDYDPDSPSDWARANPAMGIRISADYISKERAAMSEAGFARERLGIGDWPTEGGSRVIPAEKWHACADRKAGRPEAPTVFALDVDPDRSHAAIAVCGRRDDGQISVELAEVGKGLDWVIGRIIELDERWQPVGWMIDIGGPASTFISHVEQDVNVIQATYREVAQASEGFYDGVMEGSVRHTGDPILGAAVAGAAKRPCGDGWAWGRRVSSCDISPLVAVSLAYWGFLTRADELAPGDVCVF